VDPLSLNDYSFIVGKSEIVLRAEVRGVLR
jgi:hypothetical protein